MINSPRDRSWQLFLFLASRMGPPPQLATVSPEAMQAWLLGQLEGAHSVACAVTLELDDAFEEAADRHKRVALNEALATAGRSS